MLFTNIIISFFLIDHSSVVLFDLKKKKRFASDNYLSHFRETYVSSALQKLGVYNDSRDE